MLTVTPAGPWRRLTAAAIDTLILSFIYGAIWFLCVAALPGPSSGTTIVEFVSPLIGLLYLALFWKKRGATPGMGLLGIRIVRYDGKNLTWADSFRRLAGYVLAALPWHIGFLSIFRDKYRRGWHDFIARTVVIRSNAGHNVHPLPPPASKATTFTSVKPFPLRARHWLIATIIFTGLSILFTYPTVRRFSTHVAGDGPDTFHFMWTLWHARGALFEGREALLSTDSLFHPLKTHLLYHSNCFAYGVPGALVQSWLTLTQTYNLFFLLSFVLSALAAFALAAQLGCDFLGSVLAGFLFAFSPYVTAHGAAGHLELVGLQFIALFALFSYRALTESRFGWGIAAGLAFAVVGYGAWYYVVAAGLMLPCLAFALLWERKANREMALQSVRTMSLIYGIGVLCLLPLLWPMIRERSERGYMDMPLAVSETYSVDPAAAFANPMHPLWGKWVSDHVLSHPPPEPVAGFSITGLVLCLIAAVRFSRRLFPWIITGMFFFVVSCGPTLRVMKRHVTLPAWLLLLVGGPPGNGLDHPLSADLSLTLTRSLASGASMSGERTITLPFYWLRRFLPPVRPIRSPARFAVVALLCAAAMSGLGLGILREAAGRWRRWAGTTAIAGIALCAIGEFTAIPFPVQSTKVSAFYLQIAKDRMDYVIADVPVEDGRDYNYYQTVHRKPLFFGFISRVPPAAMKFRNNNALLTALSPVGEWANRRSLVLLSTLADDPEFDELRARFLPALNELRSVGGKYFIVHKPFLTTEALHQTDHLLREVLGLPVRWEDMYLRAYEMR